MSDQNSLIPQLIHICVILQVVCGVILMFVGGSAGKSNVWTSISCYITIFISGMLLVGFYMHVASKGTQSGVTPLILAKFTPVVCMLLFLGFYIIKLSMYIDAAASGNLPPSYYTLSYILMGFVAMQFTILFHTRAQTSDTIKNTSLYLLIIGIFSAVTIVSLDIVLKFFTTDGFHGRPNYT